MGSRRIPASRQTGERIEELLAGGGDHDIRSDLIRLGVRKLVALLDRPDSSPKHWTAAGNGSRAR